MATIKYQIYYTTSKEVCVPSTDYYARQNDHSTESITVLETYSDDMFDSMEEALQEITNAYGDKAPDYYEKFVILPTIKFG